jgi:hypothetical protein
MLGTGDWDVVAEVPGHDDQFRRDYEFLAAADLGAPLEGGGEPVGAGNQVTSCGLHVFVDEAAEPASS